MKQNRQKIGALGVLNFDQVIEFLALHEKRNIEQIKDIIKGFRFTEGINLLFFINRVQEEL
jgi:hypothetical protein